MVTPYHIPYGVADRIRSFIGVMSSLTIVLVFSAKKESPCSELPFELLLDSANNNSCNHVCDSNGGDNGHVTPLLVVSLYALYFLRKKRVLVRNSPFWTYLLRKSSVSPCSSMKSLIALTVAARVSTMRYVAAADVITSPVLYRFLLREKWSFTFRYGFNMVFLSVV
jgi:hypothetical protein